MSSVTLEITHTGKYWIDGANDGQTVTYSMPAGCVVRLAGEVVTTPSPFTHSGPRGSYEVWCDVYTTPATAALAIT